MGDIFGFAEQPWVGRSWRFRPWEDKPPSSGGKNRGREPSIPARQKQSAGAYTHPAGRPDIDHCP